MPIFLKLLSVIGTAAMIWVGGGIIIHGLEGYGLPALGHGIEEAAEAAGHALPALEGLVHWAVGAAAAGIFGLILGGLLIPLVQYVVAPLWTRIRGRQDRAAGIECSARGFTFAWQARSLRACRSRAASAECLRVSPPHTDELQHQA
jgi:hypothetical protein